MSFMCCGSVGLRLSCKDPQCWRFLGKFVEGDSVGTVIAFYVVIYSAYQLFMGVGDIAYIGILISDMASDYLSFILDQSLPLIQGMGRTVGILLRHGSKARRFELWTMSYEMVGHDFYVVHGFLPFNTVVVCLIICFCYLSSRWDMLKIHSSRMNLIHGIDLKKIAEKMNGASDGELKAVCTEARMFALRERRVHVTQEDFEMAVAKAMKKDTEKNMWLQKFWK
ncbi:hypothetical protein RHGRI_007939 [Rhododendron griersonianum]|uniref:AAA ATPase AAA+ lid domain-containing protein n=1 Tax=Rhododendron griersonianum TaxID=479676 RepID=A0AAV6KZM6_9ERIC|nr:hypothetical protein RHGRI_007939 [Rhododendron griersonianum]